MSGPSGVQGNVGLTGQVGNEGTAGASGWVGTPGQAGVAGPFGVDGQGISLYSILRCFSILDAKVILLYMCPHTAIHHYTRYSIQVNRARPSIS